MNNRNHTQPLFLKHTHLQGDDNHEDLLFLVRQDVFHKSPAGANQCQCDEQESPFEPGKHINTNSHKNLNTKWTKLHIPEKLYLQVSDVIHDGPAFDRMPLSVDEVVVDLRDTTREVSYTDKESRHWAHSKQSRQNKQTSK